MHDLETALGPPKTAPAAPQRSGPPWAIVATVLPAAAALLTRMRAIDLAYHVRAGELILASGHVGRTDQFTFTSAGDPWLNQQWAADAMFALAHRLLGWGGVAILYAIATGVGFAFVYAHCRGRRASPLVAAVFTLGGFIVSTGPAPRPQALAVPLFTGTALLLTRRDRWRWLVVPMAVLWANVHGSFVLAPLLVAFVVADDVLEHRPWRSIGLFAATIVGTFVTPFGPSVWTYALDIARNDTIRRWVVEWRPPTLTSVSGFAFWASGAVVLLIAIRRHRRVRPVDAARLIVFFALAAPAIRGTLWWALILPPIVAGWFASEAVEAPVRRRLDPVAVVAAACIIALLPLAFALRSGIDPVTGAPRRLAADAPQVLVEAVRSSVPAGSRLLVYQPFASWFEFALPEDPVMVDSRIELYPDAVWVDYDRAVGGAEPWQRILDRYGVRAVVLPPDSEPQGLSKRIAGADGWEAVSDGPAGSVFVRIPSPPG